MPFSLRRCTNHSGYFKGAEMKFVLGSMIGLLTTTNAGCSSNMFQPPPPSFLAWIKSGVDRLEIKKALLECGHDSPSGFRSGRSYDDQAKASLCMEKAGYRHIDEPVGWCTNHPEWNLPSCAPGAVIPSPTADRRLSSGYCERKRSYAFCKQTAINPAACETMDFNNPPPECLP